MEVKARGSFEQHFARKSTNFLIMFGPGVEITTLVLSETKALQRHR